MCAAQADTSPVDLEWSAPANCPQQNDVQQQLMALLGQPKSATVTTPLHVSGAIEPSGERYRLTLKLERSENRGTRTIDSDDCKSLGKAAAVIVGLLVQKERLLGRELSNEELSGNATAPPATVAPPPPKAKPQAPIPPPPPQTPPPPLRRWHILLRAPEAKVDALLLPKASRGLGLAVGVSIDAWRVLLEGTLYESQSHVTRGLQDFTATYKHRALQVAGCRGFGTGLVEVAPCVLVSGNYLVSNASGSNLVSSDQTAILFSAGGGISGYLYIQRYVALVASGGARFVLNRPEFQVTTLTSTETAHKVPPGTLDATVAVEWIF